MEAVPKNERKMRLGSAEIKAYSCASSMISSIAPSQFGRVGGIDGGYGYEGMTNTVNMGAF